MRPNISWIVCGLKSKPGLKSGLYVHWAMEWFPTQARTKVRNLCVFLAITEMVPDLIWAPDFFGPWEIWAPRNLSPKKFGPWEIWAPRSLDTAWKSCVMVFMRATIFLGLIFLGDQISWGPKVRGQNEIGDYFSSDLFSALILWVLSQTDTTITRASALAKNWAICRISIHERWNWLKHQFWQIAKCNWLFL